VVLSIAKEEFRIALETLRARSFAALRMTANGLRVTARESFSTSFSRVVSGSLEFRPKPRRLEGGENLR
jgi:hypothetical protein